MFGIGMQELAIILVVALLVLGPRRLPDFARTLGKGLGEFRKASNDLRRSFMMEDDSQPKPPPPPGTDPRKSREPIGQPDQLIAPEPDAPEKESLTEAASTPSAEPEKSAEVSAASGADESGTSRD
ncbi:twin-arginine translocase TatA/TatE family subunit [Myxococcota bacterium]|nr:twin-arginine translocase TatA/TatE family subunit [Myxococcota bacterium]